MRHLQHGEEAREEIVIFECAKDCEISRDGRDNKATPSRPVEQPCNRPVDSDRTEEQRREAPVPVSVEHERKCQEGGEARGRDPTGAGEIDRYGSWKKYKEERKRI